MANVLFLVGSLREGAFSAELAKSAEKALEGKATVSYLDWKDVPVFSQDLEADAPAAVKAARAAVLAADAIWIFSPVYNAGIPGSVRNLLDWLSRALDLSDTTGVSAINEKVVTVSISSFAHQDEALLNTANYFHLSVLLWLMNSLLQQLVHLLMKLNLQNKQMPFL
jgi:NAD(P)H-dependent FMN reductase